MTNDEIRQIEKGAKSHARRKGYPQLADDFAQEALIALLADSRATIAQLFIDFLRVEYGRTGLCRGRPKSLKGSLKSSALHSMRSLDQPVNGQTDGESYHDIIASPGGDTEPEPGPWRSRVNLSGRDALICEMRFDLEMGEIEIAEAFGVTESRISQLISSNGRIGKEISQAAILAEVASIYHDDEDYSKLEIMWIAI